MSNQTGWCVRLSLHAPGTAYVMDDAGREIAFCQTTQDAERIVALANAAKLAPTKTVEEENISVPKDLLERICGMVYATRGEQHRLDYVTDHEYAQLVTLRHSGHDSIETVLTALSGK